MRESQQRQFVLAVVKKMQHQLVNSNKFGQKVKGNWFKRERLLVKGIMGLVVLFCLFFSRESPLNITCKQACTFYFFFSFLSETSWFNWESFMPISNCESCITTSVFHVKTLQNWKTNLKIWHKSPNTCSGKVGLWIEANQTEHMT